MSTRCARKARQAISDEQRSEAVQVGDKEAADVRLRSQGVSELEGSARFRSPVASESFVLTSPLVKGMDGWTRAYESEAEISQREPD